jgi:hypothetical protein
VSTSILLLLLSPFFLLVTVFGVVVIVALCQAETEDIPAILKECMCVFRRLADRLPNPRGADDALGDGATEGHNALDDVRSEEAQ